MLLMVPAGANTASIFHKSPFRSASDNGISTLILIIVSIHYRNSYCARLSEARLCPDGVPCSYHHEVRPSASLWVPPSPTHSTTIPSRGSSLHRYPFAYASLTDDLLPTETVVIASRTTSIFSEGLVLVLTCIKTLGNVRTARAVGMSMSMSVSEVLVKKDKHMCFFDY